MKAAAAESGRGGTGGEAMSRSGSGCMAVAVQVTVQASVRHDVVPLRIGWWADATPGATATPNSTTPIAIAVAAVLRRSVGWSFFVSCGFCMMPACGVCPVLALAGRPN